MRRAVLLLVTMVAVVLLATGVGLAKPAPSGPSAVDEWGSYGRGDGQFRQPSGVASDASGNIYVADRNNQRIQKFDPHGELITMWGIFGEGDGDFLYPIEVAAASGNVYVVDQKSPRVQKFDSEGNFVTKWGDSGGGDGQFRLDYRLRKGPAGIATDASENVYVVDQGNLRIQKFDSEGNFVIKWGSYGKGDGQFYYPEGLATDSSGNVYIADTYNNRIQKFDSEGITCPDVAEEESDLETLTGTLATTRSGDVALRTKDGKGGSKAVPLVTQTQDQEKRLEKLAASKFGKVKVTGSKVKDKSAKKGAKVKEERKEALKVTSVKKANKKKK